MLDGLTSADITVVGGFGSANATAELARLAPEADVLVDFTTGAAAPAILLSAARAVSTWSAAPAACQPTHSTSWTPP